MKKYIALYIMLFLLPKDSDASIVKNFFTFFTGNREEHEQANQWGNQKLANQLKKENELRLVNAFLEYGLKILSRKPEQQEYEKSFMRKTQFTEEDLKKGAFFNPFLTNREALILMLNENQLFAIGAHTEVYSYITAKTPLIISFIYNNFVIMTPNDEIVDVSELAPFLAGYTYCLRYNRFMAKAERDDINFFLDECNSNTRNKNRNYFELTVKKRHPMALATIIVNEEQPLKEDMFEGGDFALDWRKRRKEKGKPFFIPIFEGNEQQPQQLLSVDSVEEFSILFQTIHCYFPENVTREDKREVVRCFADYRLRFYTRKINVYRKDYRLQLLNSLFANPHYGDKTKHRQFNLGMINKYIRDYDIVLTTNSQQNQDSDTLFHNPNNCQFLFNVIAEEMYLLQTYPQLMFFEQGTLTYCLRHKPDGIKKRSDLPEGVHFSTINTFIIDDTIDSVDNNDMHQKDVVQFITYYRDLLKKNL